MRIVVVGLNHLTSPIEVREKVSIDTSQLPDILRQLRESRTILESVVLSTCNRTEIYAVVSSERAAWDYMSKLLQKRGQFSVEETEKYLYMHRGQVAVRHAMRVASGLDSIVIGETQILGQFSDAYSSALSRGNTGALLNQLFRLVIQIGKRAQSETAIGQAPVSVSYAAVQLCKKVFGHLEGHHALVLGAGKMSSLTVTHLLANGIGNVTIANRTIERAQSVAASTGVQVVDWTDRVAALASSDIVISSTSSPGVVLTREMVESALAKSRRSRKVLFIDIALPRDIAADVAHLKSTYLYDIDDLRGVVDANLAERERQAALVETMMDDAVVAFNTWLAEQEVVPLIAAIREKGVQIQSGVMESLVHKLPNLTEREHQLVQKHTMSIVNQLLRDPIQNMKELAIASGNGRDVAIFAQLFGISEADVARADETSVPSMKQESGNLGFANRVLEWRHSVADAVEREDSLHTLHPALR